jgi:hypothetical protein
MCRGRAPISRVAWLRCLLTSAWVATAALGAQPSESPGEYEVKAAALYNIVAFTEWPAVAFASPSAPLIIGLFGDGPVADQLAGMIENEFWRGRPVRLKKIETLADAKDCHVLYIGRSAHTRWPSIRNRLARCPVLTVCDGDNFARQSGMVELTIDRKRLRLIINVAAARAAGLGISSKVLRLAEVVGEERP